MNYEIVVIGVDGTTRPVGSVWWEMDSGKWGYQSNDPDVTEILRRIGEQGYAEERRSIESGDSIAEVVVPITAREAGFISAVEDALVSANVVELREIK